MLLARLAAVMRNRSRCCEHDESQIVLQADLLAVFAHETLGNPGQLSRRMAHGHVGKTTALLKSLQMIFKPEQLVSERPAHVGHRGAEGEARVVQRESGLGERQETAV